MLHIHVFVFVFIIQIGTAIGEIEDERKKAELSLIKLKVNALVVIATRMTVRLPLLNVYRLGALPFLTRPSIAKF